ncbi:hypothetical protein R3P38DRAFT_2793615 [Favolaschia claudopus]|uniref:Uncharacterized protein n=1 Tax=Favolaschia claudopus TaxID=2862362 RepID=A0AAW0AEU5_9AGAR
MPSTQVWPKDSAASSIERRAEPLHIDNPEVELMADHPPSIKSLPRLFAGYHQAKASIVWPICCPAGGQPNTVAIRTCCAICADPKAFKTLKYNTAQEKRIFFTPRKSPQMAKLGKGSGPKIRPPGLCRRKNFGPCFLSSLGNSELRKIKIEAQIILDQRQRRLGDVVRNMQNSDFLWYYGLRTQPFFNFSQNPNYIP